MTHPDRAVITGLGPVTSIGSGRDAFWRALLEGVDGVGEVRAFDTSAYKTHRACEVDDTAVPMVPGSIAGQEVGRGSWLAIAATSLALADAGLEPPPTETGVVIGTTGGEICVLEKMNATRHARGPGAVGAREFPKHPCHVISTNVARVYALAGPNLVVPTACAAGNYAVSIARDWISAGRASVVIAGGVDPLSKVAFTGFSRLRALAQDHCRPFDRDRRGILIGEGAGIVIVESERSARERGAHIYAEVRGAGFSCDGHHMTMPHPEGRGARLAMEQALCEAQLASCDLDLISAHGTGTEMNDRVEAIAIRAVCGEASARIPVTSIKSSIGHTMGAASALETIACAMAIETGWIPPTLHHLNPDPECELDIVAREPRRQRVRTALNNAFAFGGNNCCLVLGRDA